MSEHLFVDPKSTEVRAIIDAETLGILRARHRTYESVAGRIPFALWLGQILDERFKR